MLLFIETEHSLEEQVSNISMDQKNKNLTLQPIIIVLMHSEEPVKFFVRVDATTYIQHTILAAVDLCFKIFHVFNLSYPRQSHNVWTFIQKQFYGITTKYDQPISAVSNLLTEVKQ